MVDIFYDYGIYFDVFWKVKYRMHNTANQGGVKWEDRDERIDLRRHRSSKGGKRKNQQKKNH